MEVTPLVPQGLQVIQSYGGGGFTVAGVRHRGSILVMPNRTLAWALRAGDDLSIEALGSVIAEISETDLLLVGTGGTGLLISAPVRAALKGARVAVESMATPAACRTFNVLLAEERRVAAALMAFE